MLPFNDILKAVKGIEKKNKKLFEAFKILKLFRVIRLNKLIAYMNSTIEVKHSLMIIKLCFFLILYLHLSGCIWSYMNVFNPEDNKWIPQAFKDDGKTYEEYRKLKW